MRYKAFTSPDAVRKVSNDSGENIVGKLPSMKMGRMVLYESSIERDYIKTLDFDWDVISFQEQPFEIPYVIEGRERIYTPDFRLNRTTIVEINDVKPTSKVDDFENKTKFKVAQDFCLEKGWVFAVRTDIDIRGGLRLENINLILENANRPLNREIRTRIHNGLIGVHAPISIKKLLFSLGLLVDSVSFNTVLNMACHLSVAIDLISAPISEDTLIWLPPRFIKQRAFPRLSTPGY